MILVDTNIIINFWKNPIQEQKIIFNRNDIAISGITISELIHGAKSKKQIQMMKKAFEGFIVLNIESEDWVEVGLLLYRLKKSGISVPFQDVMITFICLKNKAKLWTLDNHFKYIQKEIKELELFSETLGNGLY